MMPLTEYEIAATLLNRLRQQLGHEPQLEQIDFVLCENDGEDTMAYCYSPDGDCVPVCFPTPPFYNPREVEAMMLRGLARVRVH